MAIDAEAWVAPYEGHQVVEALAAGKETLQLQPNSIFLSHHFSHQLQLQPDQQYFSLTPFQLQSPAPTCRAQCISRTKDSSSLLALFIG